jgi:ubiquinone/menaquinone biosynthesis C-methylase UbiE
MNKNYDEFIERVVSTDNLKERANINLSCGTNDFDAWVVSLIDGVRFSSVLDICCGTGNQLIKYAKKNSEAYIVGVDVAEESLKTAEDRLRSLCAYNYKLKLIAMEEMFRDIEISDTKFDVVSCFYGLYYSRDTDRTLEEMIEHLSEKGTLIIVGPYGKNNAAFFEILQKYYDLPKLVLRSATSFMEEEVFPILSRRLSKIDICTFVNPVLFPSTEKLLDYWQASTFFSSQHEEVVKKAIEEHFAMHGEFIMEKHVIAYIARKI